jgi:hypothetical protein
MEDRTAMRTPEDFGNADCRREGLMEITSSDDEGEALPQPKVRLNKGHLLNHTKL